MNIGGNIKAQIQVKSTIGIDRLGKPVVGWNTIKETFGFLDLLSGDSKFINFNAKIQESTHVFICDYFPIDPKVENKRVLIDGQMYDLKLIDDPMGMHKHLEVFLAFVG